MLDVPYIQLSGRRERDVIVDPGYVGRKLRCGECSHQFDVTANTTFIKTLQGKKGEVIGFTTRCERCGQDVFVAANRERKKPT